MPIFGGFRRLIEALEDVASQLALLVHAQQDVAPSTKRLDALELSRHQFEAECAGMLLKADGKLKAASNAEARERQLKKSYERDVDPFSEDGEEGSEAGPVVLPLHAAPSEAERVSALRLGMAPDRKAAAVSAKWGR